MGAHQSSRHPRRRFNRSSQDDEEIRLINEDMVRDEDGRMRVQVPPSMEYEWNSYGARTSQFLCFTGRRKMENVVHSLLVRQVCLALVNEKSALVSWNIIPFQDLLLTYIFINALNNDRLQDIHLHARFLIQSD